MDLQFASIYHLSAIIDYEAIRAYLQQAFFAARQTKTFPLTNITRHFNWDCDASEQWPPLHSYHYYRHCYHPSKYYPPQGMERGKAIFKWLVSGEPLWNPSRSCRRQNLLITMTNETYLWPKAGCKCAPITIVSF